MSFESSEQVSSVASLEFDPKYGPMVQELALKYLQTEQAEYYEREFSGVDEEGRLIPKGDALPTFPSQSLGDEGLRVVGERLAQELAK